MPLSGLPLYQKYFSMSLKAFSKWNNIQEYESIILYVLISLVLIFKLFLMISILNNIIMNIFVYKSCPTSDGFLKLMFWKRLKDTETISTFKALSLYVHTIHGKKKQNFPPWSLFRFPFLLSREGASSPYRLPIKAQYYILSQCLLIREVK